ncbi:hypothetical protein [Absidia glauca]|uniref:Uncharacterized protein n=1 Tax=Absidia glauca TaxID=4829 RepID=A0A163M331_ABSGL|nr:hypothetical protein [Absidia glauca]
MDSFGTDDGIYLSQMCALLVDAPKQGYKLKFWAKKDDRAKYANRPVPTWFLEKLKKTRDTEDGQPARNPLKPADRPLTTAMDFLHFAIQQEIEKLAKTPQSLIPEDLVTRKDNDLALPWNKAVETAKALGDEAMQADLETIRDAVEVNFTNYMQDIRDVVNYLAQKADSQWTSTRSQMEGGKTSSVKENRPGVLGECINKFSSFLQIEQHYAKVFHEMAMDSLVSTTLKMDIMVNDGRLVQTLKGSCAYLRTVTKGKYNKYCYVVAYDVLARIKSDVCAKKSKLNGICNTVVPSIYPAMHMDRRWIRKYKDIRLLGK